jgi:uncharacterized protein involved in type VI secretion and phage assembly
MEISSRTFTSTVYITVNGSPLPDSQVYFVHEVVVEQSLHLPSMFVLRFYDNGDPWTASPGSYFDLIDNDVFPIGATIQISVGYGETPAQVFDGEITAVDLDAVPGGAPLVVVRGYDKAHRLHRGRRDRSFLNMSDSDIATKVAGDAGLSATGIDSTSVVYDYIYQRNQTDWEFLKERAARNGYEVFVNSGALYFRKPQSGQVQGPELKLGDNLMSIKVKVSSADLLKEVHVRSWDPKNKEAVVGSATLSDGTLVPSTGLEKTGSEVAASFGDATLYVVDRPVTSQSEADTIAKALVNQAIGTYVQAEGLGIGDPDIKPGVSVDLKSIGNSLSGTYYVTAATHRLTAEGYTTSFTASGAQSDSLVDFFARRDESLGLPRVVTGVVTDLSDPDDEQCRVRVKFPWLSADDDTSYWARLASPMAGPNRGIFFLPEINDEVLVAFEHGDMARPFIIGSLWNGKDAPPEKNGAAADSSGVNHRIIKTRAGHVITLDDTSGSELISIVDKTGNNLIKIESSSNKITIQADGDIVVNTKANVKVTAQQDAEVTVQGKATVNAQSDVAVNGMNVSVEAKGNATVKASTGATVQSQANLDLKGAVVNVESQGTMSIKANGPLQIQGAIVQIN